MENQMENQEPNPMAHPSHIWNWISAIALIISIVALVTIYTQISKANADYICTYIVEENDPCGNGSWGDWETVSTSGDHAQCTEVTNERRVYTGTRETRHILQYLNLRTGCDAGYAQSGNGEGGGASGFHGGSIISETAACQIEEMKVTEDIAGTCGVGGGDSDDGDVDVTTTSTETDIEVTTQTTSISAKEQLTQFRESKIDGQITADPERLRSGTPTTVQWQGVEVTSCTVTGSNGDSWTGTAGQQLSSPLDTSTTFTLNCTAFNDTTVQESVEVVVVPSFQEI
jgi:hypothetical protein